MKKMIYALAFLMMAMPGFALNLSIPGNSTYQFNYTNSTNGTESVFFFAQPVFIHSGNLTNLSLSLDSGQIYTYVDGNVHLTATCQAFNMSSDGVCSINRLLKPGETYDRASGPCDVEFTCQEVLPKEDEKVCLGVVQRNYSIPYSISDNAERTVFKFGPDEKVFPGNASYEFSSEVVYACDVPIDFTAEDLGPGLESLCGETNPYLLKWYDTTFQSYQRLQENCDSNKDENRAEVNTLQGQYESCSSTKIELQGQVQSAQDKYDDAVIELDKVRGEKGTWTALSIMGLVLMCLSLPLGGLGWFLYFRNRKGGDGQ